MDLDIITWLFCGSKFFYHGILGRNYKSKKMTICYPNFEKLSLYIKQGSLITWSIPMDPKYTCSSLY